MPLGLSLVGEAERPRRRVHRVVVGGQRVLLGDRLGAHHDPVDDYGFSAVQYLALVVYAIAALAFTRIAAVARRTTVAPTDDPDEPAARSRSRVEPTQPPEEVPMEQRRLGSHRSARLGAVPRHDDVRQRGRRGDEQGDRRPLPRRRRQLRRHRQRLLAGLSEEITGRGARLAARRGGARDQGALPDGRRPERRRALAAQHPHAGRGVAAPARHRVDRPLPGALLGPAHAARGDASPRSTTSSTRARSATSARATSPAGTWPRRSGSPRCTTGSRS